MNEVGVVLIGRNEGERLLRALDAALRDSDQVVYVDSGSSDNSVAESASRGVHVVELDTSIPFTAARARNAGFHALVDLYPNIKFVQFIDGDCVLEQGWIEKAQSTLSDDQSLAIVFGRRSEEYPEASLFHRIIDMEWRVKPGFVDSCGGDTMMRVDLLREVGGFDPSVAAGEEPELSMRLRDRGAKLLCVNEPMTKHDAQIYRLGQFIRRDIRTGRGGTDVWLRFRRGDNPFNFLVKKLVQWGWCTLVLLMFGVILICLEPWRWIGVAGIFLVLLSQVFRSVRQMLWAQKQGLVKSDALRFGMYTPISTCAQMYGQVTYFIDVVCKRHTRLVEYKGSGGNAVVD